ncbi:UDP-N-acetylmuramoyl-tripeptide--D-alanyl-D-alanine ligase [Dietzia sp. UCD-THP]|uniref:UDP-N-acetylmuramoyl-tripeptide--D-alanyl-D- alanine ligase n=1 Tax=Dietzia sp. UCD-THP TaxID=1292020 RepID=UPI00037C9C86|nr:UDP-N-acetylmuramoyl-tripeptide--D-alanyl-D-alanine ligase [Dietzia sp. UCD-THP]EYT64364.1 UDP-N-acetylmuramoyl-tripeptide--D-alanyl-D-alanine ligase [Dietzia sp. UCD-THP]
MIDLTLGEIAGIVGGRLVGGDPSTAVTGSVEFDSRRIEPGGLFLALPGERVDGHEFVGRALQAGAAAALVAREVTDAPGAAGAQIVVPPVDRRATNAMALAADSDGSGAAVLAALGALARASVDRLVADHGLVVVGITGSSGKTSTKDLIGAVLSAAGTVVAPPGSFNNEIGHPWTALRADESTDFLVLELSARAPGNIRELAEIAPPRIGVVLNVGTAHLGEFGSRDVIAATKGELVEALPDAAHGGVAVLNADDDRVLGMAGRTSAEVVTVGSGRSADLRAEGVRVDDEVRASFRLVTPDGEADVALRVHGEHQVGNALSAAAVGLACGMDVSTIAGALGTARAASARRMDVRVTADGVTVINDSYNANPDSVRAALKSLAVMARSGGGHRRTWAILGEMAELGEDSVTEHDLIGRFLVRLDVSQLVVVGRGRPQRALFQGAVQEGSWGSEAEHVGTAEEACAVVDEKVRPGDIVLVKASAAVGLWSVAEHLLATRGEETSE